MIKKLKLRILLIIMIPLSIITICIIGSYSYLNYKNTINATTFVIESFESGLNNKNVEEKTNDIFNIDGIYRIYINNIKDFNNMNMQNNILEEYSAKIINKEKNSGIIGKYIYKVKRNRDNSYIITFIKNEKAISHIKWVIVYSIIAGVVTIIIIYLLAKKLSQIIVKPVEETFEKQKQFISDASHELKTPLAVIEANADVLENNTSTNKWINYIQKEIESMNKLINELLLLTKIENIDNTREYEKFDLSKEIEIISSTFEGLAYENEINIKTNIEENLNFNGNKEDIKHILSTLIDNAIKHTKSKKDIIVELKKEKTDLIIQVKNFGEKIPEEEKQKIFERFYRIDKSRNRNEKRYGLGLAIAKATVEKYNGKIEVFYENNYTIFKVIIPDNNKNFHK